uniref:Uncharacterized protein n=2 Tax=Anopheles atroparvus TaxID=41427 RepID=A0AAG5DGC8_ANOAO
MERAQEKHKDHSWVLPPFVDNIMWNQFMQSKLAGALWVKLGLLTVYKDFHGKLYYNYSSCCITNRSTALDQNGHDLPSRVGHLHRQPGCVPEICRHRADDGQRIPVIAGLPKADFPRYQPAE